MQRFQRLAQTAAPWLIAAAFVAVEIRRVAEQIAARYPDFFAFADRAAAFDLHRLAQWNWVDGLYPFGYPLLLHLGVTLGLDVLQTAFVLSIVGGALGLLGAFWLVRRVTGNWTLAVLSETLLGCMAFYLFFANLDSTDMLPAGLQICSLALLVGRTNRRRESLAAGLLVGLSYLLRYTASLTILLSLIFLAGLALVRRQRENVWAAGLYLLGAGLAASPQLLASLIVQGNPFYNIEARTLWIQMVGSSDYIHVWNEAPANLSLWTLVSADPGRFFSHWWAVFSSSWRTGDAICVDTPLGGLVIAGFLFTVLVPGLLTRRSRVWVALYTVGLLALLSFTRLDRRFMLTLMPIQVMVTLYFCWRILPERLRVRRWTLPLREIVLLALVLPYVRCPLAFMNANLHDEQVVAVSNTLHAAGMQDASDVLSTNVEFHDVSDPWKERYDMAFSIAPDLGSYDELLDLLAARAYCWFIFDRQTGVSSLYPDLEWLLYPENRPASLTPVYVPEDRAFAVYRVEDGDWPGLQPVDVALANGVVLKGYEVNQSPDAPRGSGWGAGLYLHWEATTPVTRSFKVFVHVLDGAGQLVAQHDGIPALWTYTTDRWAVGERVIDFHPLHLTGPGPFTIRVGMYDVETGQRAPLADDPSAEWMILAVDL